MVRGSGMAWDLRRSQPHECYDEFDFQIPVGKNGDCYDRLPCPHGRDARKLQDHAAGDRRNCAEPARGDVLARGKLTPPRRADMKRDMESLIHHFKLYTEGFKVPAGEVYAAVEAPKGRIRRLIWSPTAPTKPWRAVARPRFRASAIHRLDVQGHMLADIPAIIATLDIVFGEVDR